MNNKFSVKTPRFKTVEERHTPASNSPHTADRRRESREFSAKTDRLSAREAKTVYPQTAKKVQGEGSVNILLKGGKNSVPAEKKTGALSPRAPEKIRHNRATEMKVYGENACKTLFQQRPESIVRLWATVEGAKKAGELLSYLAEQKKAYHVVSREEMEKVTGSEHHGDICLLVKKAMPLSLEGYLQLPRRRDCLVLLDGVNNAQNIGGIMRTCAFYGVKGIVTDNPDLLHSAAAARVAEGGLEFIRGLETKHKQIALQQLRQAGYQIISLTRQKQAKPLAGVKLADKVVFVLSEIVPSEIEYPEDTNLQLSTANPLNSGLNVAVNTGVLLAYWYQTNL